jgi:hypothetical protein
MERLTLWQQAENTLLAVLRGLIRVGYLPQESRVAQLINVSADVDMLRVFLRLSLDVNALPQKKHIKISNFFQITSIYRGNHYVFK